MENTVSGSKMMSMAKKLAVIAVGLILFGIIMAVGIEFTCNSWFCISCHKMKELDTTWNFSKHGPYVSNNPKMHDCLKCHAQPGLKGFLKARISGFLCLIDHQKGNDYHRRAIKPVVCIRGGCHQLKDLDEADRSNRPGRIVVMSHARHIKLMKKGEKEPSCMPCHRNVARGEDKYSPDMKKDCLVTCHSDQGLAECTSCHPTHPDVRLKGRDSSLLDLHKGANISCTQCHPGLCKAPAAICKECHEDKSFGDPKKIEKRGHGYFIDISNSR